MKCIYCNTENENNNLFCANCGEKLNDGEVLSKSENNFTEFTYKELYRFSENMLKVNLANYFLIIVLSMGTMIITSVIFRLLFKNNSSYFYMIYNIPYIFVTTFVFIMMKKYFSGEKMKFDPFYMGEIKIKKMLLSSILYDLILVVVSFLVAMPFAAYIINKMDSNLIKFGFPLETQYEIKSIWFYDFLNNLGKSEFILYLIPLSVLFGIVIWFFTYFTKIFLLLNIVENEYSINNSIKTAIKDFNNNIGEIIKFSLYFGFKCIGIIIMYYIIFLLFTLILGVIFNFIFPAINILLGVLGGIIFLVMVLVSMLYSMGMFTNLPVILYIRLNEKKKINGV